MHVILLKKDVSKMKIVSMLLALCGLSCGMVSAQSPQAANPTQEWVQSQSGAAVPIYRVIVTERTMKAINYKHPKRRHNDRFQWHLAPAECPWRSQSGEQKGLHRDRSGIR